MTTTVIQGNQVNHRNQGNCSDPFQTDFANDLPQQHPKIYNILYDSEFFRRVEKISFIVNDIYKMLSMFYFHHNENHHDEKR